MRREVIVAKDVCFRYQSDGPLAVDHVSFSVQAGEWVAICGHNGSGKSTLARLLNGLLFPEHGSIAIDGTATTNQEKLWEIRRKVGVVFQNPDNQFVGTTVLDDVAFGPENHGVPREEMKHRVHQAIEKVGMAGYEQHEPHRLSGGQKQRVAIAGVLAVQPTILILDEATSMLDPKGRREVMNTVRILNKQENVTVLSITHDLEEAALADRIIVMNQGKILDAAPPAKVFRNADTLREIGLDLPFAVRIRQLLQKSGLSLSDDIVTREGLVEQLWKLKWNS